MPVMRALGAVMVPPWWVLRARRGLAGRRAGRAASDPGGSPVATRWPSGGGWGRPAGPGGRRGARERGRGRAPAVVRPATGAGRPAPGWRRRGRSRRCRPRRDRPEREQPVGPDHVADVGEVAARGEVADGDDVVAVALGPGDAAGQRRGDELLRLAGADVVERAHAEDAEAVAEVGLVGEGLGGDLRGGVRAGGAQWCLLVEGQVGLGHDAVDVGAGDAHDPVGAGVAAGLEDVEGADGVEDQRTLGIAPGGADVGPPGEVVHDLGGGLGDHGEGGGGIGDVGPAVGVVEHGDRVAAAGQVLHEVPADEPAAPGHQRAHRPWGKGDLGTGRV